MVAIPEEDRSAILLALADLSLARPGWFNYLRGIAETLDGGTMFDGFRVTSGLPPGSPADTSNDFGVVRVSALIKVLYWDRVAHEHSITLNEAIVLGSWLLKLADPDGREYPRVMEAIGK